MNKYEDNNNYFKINTIHFSDNRVQFWKPKQHFRFIDFDVTPRWTGPARIRTDITSFDAGKTYQRKEF